METTTAVDTNRIANLAAGYLRDDDYFFEYVERTIQEALTNEGIDPFSFEDNDYIDIINGVYDLMFKNVK